MILKNDRQLKEYVLQKHNFKCTKCGDNKFLEAHHIIPRTENRDLIYETENLTLLCQKCHRETHSEIRRTKTINKTTNQNIKKTIEQKEKQEMYIEDYLDYSIGDFLNLITEKEENDNLKDEIEYQKQCFEEQIEDLNETIENLKNEIFTILKNDFSSTESKIIKRTKQGLMIKNSDLKFLYSMFVDEFEVYKLETGLYIKIK